MKQPNCKPRRSWQGIAMAAASLAVVALPTALPALAQETAVEITRAEWRSGDRELRVEGRNRTRSTLTVTNANPAVNQSLGSGGTREEWRVRVSNPSPVPCRVKATTASGQSAERNVRNAPANCDGGVTPPPGGGNPPLSGDFSVLAANDLGMHCADQDYQIFSILPPFNVIHAQVVRKSVQGTTPRLMTDADVEVFYESVSNPGDPVAGNSITTFSQNTPTIFKSNFWDANGYGTTTYRRLYPTTDKVTVGGVPICNTTNGCASALDLFTPLANEVGLPVPAPDGLPLDPNLRYTRLPAESVRQQNMPGPANAAQKFARFDGDLPFFEGFPFGTTVQRANWFAADGVPILPVDDQGRSNAYPMMKIKAVEKGTGRVLASTDIVVPVASEADCFSCHALAGESNGQGSSSNGFATEFASVKQYKGGAPLRFLSQADASVPGPEKLNNATKINILRLHDAKHGDRYTSSVDGTAVPCMNGTEASCLDSRRRIQCSQCHYSPALDLAQVGPRDETTMGEEGRQQSRHISMSRAMHGFHGQVRNPLNPAQLLFPDMPPPGERTPDQAQQILQDACYNCHPGKRVQCLRDVMSAAGNVCQDCHGQMRHVGNDFSGNLASGGGLDLSKRVPWANEPKCQSCHVGDARTVGSFQGNSDYILASDRIRLKQAFTRSAAEQADRNNVTLAFIESPGSRFAEDQALYRLSKGHGGVKCEGCHGSTHAVWPVPGRADARPGSTPNDNVTANQLQGHTGSIIECNVCHAPGSLGLTLDGPHGMHPVADRNWNLNHEDVAERNSNACRACHGNRGEGTVLSRTATDRVYLRDDDGRTISVPKGTQVRCDSCHENELN